MNLAERYTAIILRHRSAAFALFLAVLVLLSAGLPRLEFSSNTRDFFGEGNQDYLDLLAVEETFSRPDTVLIAVIPPQGAAFEPSTLDVLRRMTEEAWQVPYVLRVDSPVNHMHTFAEGDDVFVEPMLDEFAEITPELAMRFADLAMGSDALRNSLLSDQGDVFGITIRFVLPEGEGAPEREVESFIRAMESRWEVENPGWQFHTLGGILANFQLRQVAIEDIRFLVPLSFMVAMGVLTLALGSFRTVAVTISVMAAATLATFGFAGWVGIPLTAGTAIGPLAVMVLVSTSCVHIVLGTVRAHEIQRHDQPFLSALRENLAPVSVSHLTTAFGFLCLNFAPSPPLADMGNVVAFGLIFGLPAVFILLPFFFASHPPTSTGKLMVTQNGMRRFARWVQQTHRVWLIGFPLAGLLAVFGVSRIEFDDNVIRYFDQRYEVRQDAEIIQDRLTGLENLQFSLVAPAGSSVFEPNYLRSVDQFVAWLEQQPGVISVAALSNIIKDINRSMSGDEPAAEVIAETQEANAQLLMFYELSLPVGMDMNNLLDVDRTRSLVSATVRTEHARELRELSDRAERWLEENESSIATRATGLSIAFSRISERNNSQMLIGFLVVLTLVSFTLILTLRSVKYGVLSLAPNLLPALLAFGFWGMILRDVNLGSTVVTTMTFGIVVDDTIHFLMYFLRCRRRNMPSSEALEETFAFVGSSILLTSLALMFGFGIMAASGFAINQHIGLLTAVVIFFALLSDLLFLPAVLAKLKGFLEMSMPRRNFLKGSGASCMIGLSAPAFAQSESAEARGLRIATEASDRSGGYQDITSQGEMILRTASGQNATRRFETRWVTVRSNETRSLMIFEWPGDIRNTALLTHAYLGRDDDQWLFLPAMDRVRRISGSGRSGSFVGSEFAFEDMVDQEVDKFDHTWINDGPCPVGGGACHVIDRVPTSRSGYSRQRIWLDQEHLRLQQVEYYDRRGALLKTLQITGYQLYAGQWWRSAQMDMVNHLTGASTRLNWSNYMFNTGLSPNSFTESALRRIR